MKLAKKWGATNFDEAMARAACGGETECMKLAKKWGASDFNRALLSAADKRQLNSMELAVEWGATQFHEAKRLAYVSEEGWVTDDYCERACDDWIDELSYEKISGLHKKLEQAKKEISDLSKKLEQAEKEIEIMRTSGNTHSTNLFSSCQEPVPATPPPITRLPPEMIVESFSWLTGEEKVLCVMTCRNWHDLIKRCAPKLVVSSNDLLKHAAKNGYRNLLELAKQIGATNFNGTIDLTATGGNIKLMKLLRDWLITQFIDQITAAAHKNNILATCTELLEGRRSITDYNWILYCAANGGHIDCMKLAKKWGAADFNMACNGAAQGGHIECLKLLKSWGATKFNYPLRDAAKGGSLKCMKLLKEWGVTKFNWALHDAAEYGQIECMKLLKNWGATKFARAFGSAVWGGQIESMKLLKKWGALRTTNIDDLLWSAAKHWHIDCLKLLKKWGAVDFNGALVATVVGECDDRPSFDNFLLDENETLSQIKCMKLLKEWGATNFNEALAATWLSCGDSGEERSWHKFNPEAVKILKGWIAVTCKPSNKS